ncbi:exo-alpha-sialidase [Helicobacter himalayensis]|uniref:exo-alpha-sialidase n=1 Tax=Helicobacter himalayensis TaxID=1591088 RepID=UPI003D6EAA6D
MKQKIVLFVLCVLFVGVGSYLRLRESGFEVNNARFVTMYSPLDSVLLKSDSQPKPYNLTRQIDIPTDSDISQLNFSESNTYTLIPNFEKSAHASTLVDLDSRLMVLFFAGSKEGARDIKIYQSFLPKGSIHWSEPRAILDTLTLSRLSGKFIKKLGNPIAFRDSLNRVHMFVVGVSLGGWATSKVYQFLFDEDLEELQYKGELHLGVFLNFSHLVRTPAIALENGGFMLPLYHELANKYPLVAFFDADSKLLFTKRLNSLKSQLQPSIIALNESECLAMFRIHRGYENKAFLQKCKDFGNTWEAPSKSNIQNFDSSSVLLALPQNPPKTSPKNPKKAQEDSKKSQPQNKQSQESQQTQELKNEVLLIHNDGLSNPLLSMYDLFYEKVKIHPRASISLFYLRDAEKGIFERLMTIDALKDGEVSYPSASLDSQNLYITYTYDRTQIKYSVIPLDSIFELIRQSRESPQEIESAHDFSLIKSQNVQQDSQNFVDSQNPQSQQDLLDDDLLQKEDFMQIIEYHYMSDVG